MNRPLLPLFLAAGVALGMASCTPPNDKTATDSTTGNAAAAADTTGAHNQLAKDAAGVQLDSASTKMTDKTGGPGTATDRASSQGETK